MNSSINKVDIGTNNANFSKKKILFIVIPIIVIIIIILVVLGLLYLTTDLFKSNQTLFLKYATQNIDAMQKVVDNTSEKEYSKLLKENKYEINATLEMTDVKDINTSSEDKSGALNNLNLTIKGQSDYQNSYAYRDIDINNKNAETNEEESVFGIEYIHNQNIYGIKFSDIFNQYISIDSSSLEELESKTDAIDAEQIQTLLDLSETDFYELFSFTDEELDQMQTTYLDIISNNISKDSYSKQSNALITVGDQSIDTTAYTLTLTQEQVNNIYIQLLEQLKTDQTVLNKLNNINDTFNQNTVLSDEDQTELYVETTDEETDSEESSTTTETDTLADRFAEVIDDEITEIKNNNIGTEEVKYTVYQVDGQTVRTEIEEGNNKTVIDLETESEKQTIKIEKTIATDSEENTLTAQIGRTDEANNDSLNIQIEQTANGVTSTTEIYRNINVNESNITTSTGIKYNDGDENEVTGEYNENIEIISELTDQIVLEEGSNNYTLNNYDEQTIESIMTLVEEKLSEKLSEGILNEVASEIESKNSEEGTTIEPIELSEIEKNTFNANFEMFTGTEVTAEKIEGLLNIAKNNLESAQVSYSDNGSSSTDKKLQSIRLKIAKDTENEALAESVLDLIDDGKKYTVTIQYSDSTGLVEYVAISVNE